MRILLAVQTFSVKGKLDGYLQRILPALVVLSENSTTSLRVRADATRTIATIARSHDIKDNASRLIHSSARILSQSLHTLHIGCLEVLCITIKQIGYG